jgi:hypothetical protein
VLYITKHISNKLAVNSKPEINIISLEEAKETLLTKNKWYISPDCTIMELGTVISLVETVPEIDIVSLEKDELKDMDILLVNYLGTNKDNLDPKLCSFKELFLD